MYNWLCPSRFNMLIYVKQISRQKPFQKLIAKNCAVQPITRNAPLWKIARFIESFHSTKDNLLSTQEFIPLSSHRMTLVFLFAIAPLRLVVAPAVGRLCTTRRFHPQWSRVPDIRVPNRAGAGMNQAMWPDYSRADHGTARVPRP